MTFKGKTPNLQFSEPPKDKLIATGCPKTDTFLQWLRGWEHDINLAIGKSHLQSCLRTLYKYLNSFSRQQPAGQGVRGSFQLSLQSQRGEIHHCRRGEALRSRTSHRGKFEVSFKLLLSAYRVFFMVDPETASSVV